MSFSSFSLFFFGIARRRLPCEGVSKQRAGTASGAFLDILRHHSRPTPYGAELKHALHRTYGATLAALYTVRTLTPSVSRHVSQLRSTRGGQRAGPGDQLAARVDANDLR